MNILCINPSLVPRRSKKKTEKSTWYPLITHAWLPRFSGELGNFCDTSPCYTTVHYWITRVVTSTCSLVHSTKVCHVSSGKVRKPRTALKDEQLMAVQHVYTARTCLYGYRQIQQVDMCESYRLCLCLTSTLERQRWHITITDLQATFLHGVAAHCNRIFYQNSSLCYYICEFSLRISINYTENV